MSLDLQRPASTLEGPTLGNSRSSISDFRRPLGVDPHQDAAEAELREVLQRLQFSGGAILLERLREIYEGSLDEGGGVLPMYSTSTAELLVEVLLLHCSEKTQSMLHPAVTPGAKQALSLLFGFLQHCEHFSSLPPISSAYSFSYTLHPYP